MSTKNLSTVASKAIETYGITATNVINTYRYGGERVIGFFDQRFASAVNRGASALGKSTRSSLLDGQQRVSGLYVKGLHFGTDRAQSAVGMAVDLATKGVGLVASNAKRLDRSTNLNALDKLNRVAMPAVTLLSNVAERLEEGSTELVKRVAGKPMPVKAVAKRKLNVSKRKAAATRKQVTKDVTKTASQQVEKAVATRKRVTKRVSKAVADTATQTSNAARRVARKAETVAAEAA
jgi:hypothetical protein